MESRGRVGGYIIFMHRKADANIIFGSRDERRSGQDKQQLTGLACSCSLQARVFLFSINKPRARVQNSYYLYPLRDVLSSSSLLACPRPVGVGGLIHRAQVFTESTSSISTAGDYLSCCTTHALFSPSPSLPLFLVIFSAVMICFQALPFPSYFQ